MAENILFLADSSLGKLAKWLRILGFDTLYQPQWPTHLIEVYLRERKRIFLTRNTRLFPRWKDKYEILFITRNESFFQLEQVIKGLNLAIDPKTFFTRCLTCNIILSPLIREEVENKVPEYIFINQTDFQSCTSCKKIFWPGSHPKRMLAVLAALKISDLGFRNEKKRQ